MGYFIRGAALAALGLAFVGSYAQFGWAPGEYYEAYKPLLQRTGDRFLNRPDVRAELGITPEQRRRMEELDRQEDIEERRLKAQGLPYLEYEMRDREIERRYDQRQVLTPQQRARLLQLELQWNGAITLVNPEVAQQLRLTPQQQAQIRQIALHAAEQTYADTREVRKRERDRMIADARARVNQQILSVLTSQQRAQWQRMLGTPFQFSERK